MIRDFKIDSDFLEKLALKNASLGNLTGCIKNYNLVKFSEEATELGLVCLQKYTKPIKVADKEITDEIGDVLLRIEMFLAERPTLIKAVQERLDYKTGKYKEYKKNSTYTQI